MGYSPTVRALGRWLLILALAHLPLGPVQAQAPIVGRWDAETRSKEGLGYWMEFRPDGSMLVSFGSMVDVYYRLEKDHLVVTPHPGGRATGPGAPIRIEGRRLIGAGPVRDRVTPGSPGAPPIVGVWAYPHDSGVTAYEEFTRDGRKLFRLPVQTQGGTYRLDGQTLRLKWANGTSTVAETTIDGPTLILRVRGKPDARFHREQASIPAARPPQQASQPVRPPSR